jgi:hypothetical protein
MQIDAALHLLYYFPKEAASPIAKRLRTMDVKSTGKEINDYIKQVVANGVRTSDFIKVAATSTLPEIRDAVRDIFLRTDDVAIMLATLPCVPAADAKLVKERFIAVLKLQPADDHGAYGEGYDILVQAVRRFGSDAAPVIQDYIKNGGAQRAYTVTEVLQGNKDPFSLAIIEQLLTDKRESDTYSHGIKSPNDDNRLPIRVCDNAAEVFSQIRPDLKFDITGTTQQLDAQIQTIRNTLAKERNK